MKRSLRTFIRLMALGGLFLGVPKADANALVCSSPHFQPAGTAWCDADPARFVEDTLCVVEPVVRSSDSPFDEAITGDGVCILGKFKNEAVFQRVVDFVVSYDFLGATPLEDLIQNLSGVFVPGLDTIPGSREVLTVLPLGVEGPYDITFHTHLLQEDGTVHEISPTVRHILRIAPPHLTVTNGRAGGSPLRVSPLTGDSDGDGICDGPDPIPGLCTRGPDSVNNTPGSPPSHAVSLTSPAAKATTVDLCINGHGTEPSAGNAFTVSAVNTIIDSSVTPSRSLTVKSSCLQAGHTICQHELAADTFCPGGWKVTVPLGNGENQIELEVDQYLSRPALGDQFVASQKIRVVPFNVDLKGPSLCVKYLKDSKDLNSEIANVDGRALLASEANQVTVDVTLGDCGKTPEVLSQRQSCQDLANPPPCTLDKPEPADRVHRVCISSQNGAFQVMCPVTLADGKIHYQAPFNELHFPMNTATIKAQDDLGNETLETHSFGYGTIRPLFDRNGHFNLQKAMVPNGVGGYIPDEFIRGDLKRLVLKVVQSDEFKDKLFPKLLDPHQPTGEEITCLRNLSAKVGSSYDHLASTERVVAIKPFKGGADGFHIGSIDVPSLFLLNDNRIRLQLKINDLTGRAELYTIQFVDTDHDGVVDTEDDDADNDGICDRFVKSVGPCTDANHDGVCDEEVGIFGSQGKGLNASGKCVLDKSIPRAQCPDVDATDKHYWGCSDQDDDGDSTPGNSIPDDHDLPGRLIEDPDFGTFIIPVKLAVKEMEISMDVSLHKDSSGRLRIEIDRADDQADRHLIVAIPEDKYLIEFDCNKERSEIYQGGRAGDVGNGRHLWIDREACESLQSLNTDLSKNSDPLTNNIIETSKTGKLNLLGLIKLPFWQLIHAEQRANQTINQQFYHTFEATLQCSTPRRVEAMLDKFETEKVTAVTAKLFDKNFHLDFYAPLASANVSVDPRGIGFSGKGLLVPAGVTGVHDTAERNATDFLNTLPDGFRDQKFGPLSRAPDAPNSGEEVDPSLVAAEMGSALNLALNEETVNSVLHSVGLLLWDLANQEGDAHQSLDLSANKIRKDFDFAIPDIGGDGKCYDKDGKELLEATHYQCFSFLLTVENTVGPLLNYVDLNNDRLIDGADLKTPVIIRNGIDPLSPPTVRVVSVTPIQSWNGNSAGRPASIMAELEIGLGNARMSVFEEMSRRVEHGQRHAEDGSSGEFNGIEGTGSIKSWCDTDRFPGMNPSRCGSNKPLPMVTFAVSGRLFVTLLLSVKDDGIIRVEGGVSSVIKETEGQVGQEIVLDSNKTYLDLSVLENNTLIPDSDLATQMRGKVETILTKYLFANARDIRAKIPTRLPLEAFCGLYRREKPHLCDCVANPGGEDCNNISKIQDLWESLGLGKFGVEGLTLVQPLLGATDDTFGPTRYLTIGAGVDFKLAP